VKNAVIVRLPLRALESALDLPKGARVTGVRYDANDAMTQVLSLRIDHPDLPDVPEGARPVEADLVFAQSRDKGPTRIVMALPEGDCVV
jgi:hypothetical protein